MMHKVSITGLEEMEKVVKENSDLKSRLVSMDIDRNELLWAIKQVEKKPKEHKEILEQKDRQVSCLLYDTFYLTCLGTLFCQFPNSM